MIEFNLCFGGLGLRSLNLFTLFIVRFLLSLRYRIQVVGLEKLNNQTLTKSGGILFLANHPAEIDPTILCSILWPKFRIHPVATEYLFHKPGVRFFLHLVDSIPVPGFSASTNSFKKRQIEKTYEKIFKLLDNKQNVLLYPKGGLKSGPEEVIGGASGAHAIVQARPEINVVLVKSTGLWGSIFSKAPTGSTPDLGKAFRRGFKVLLKNFIFFTPRRKILIECTPAMSDFPWKSERREFNRYLENWFNSEGPEPLKLVSYSLFKKEFLKIKPIEEKPFLDLENAPVEIREQVKMQIADLAQIPQEQVEESKNLAMDLGFDSLDTSQLVMMLKDDFGVANVYPTDLVTVADVIAYAAGIKQSKAEEEEEEEAFLSKNWLQDISKRPEVSYPNGSLIPEVFLKTCVRMGTQIACADQVLGEISYKRLMTGVILLAQFFKKFPEERIGVLLPASIAANMLILAISLANKIPVMLNWTLGKRNLSSVLEQSKIHTTVSSWQFLNRLDNVDLNGFDEQIILLEDIKQKFSLFDVFHGFFLSKKSPSSLLKKFGSDQRTENAVFVILFTSGTENFPKGVPLSHKNIISNQRSAFNAVSLTKEDVLLAALPPFHSFGFSVTGLLPLLAGLRVVYTPNPTEGRRLSKVIERWGVTVICLAPTFMSSLLRVVKDELKTVRMVVLGAEKTPEEMFKAIHDLNPSISASEGYGITECAPILSLNPSQNSLKGVGLPLEGVKIKIVNPETYEELESEQTGLILATGPNIFEGYLDKSIEDPFINREGKRWYITGDLGYFDKEGYLFLSGRLKRFIKIGGEMISLNSIEEALLAALKSKSSDFDPDKPVLAVSSKEEEGKKSEVHVFTVLSLNTEEANQILKNSGMSNLVKVREVHQVRFIPQLGTGKVDYRQLMDKIQQP